MSSSLESWVRRFTPPAHREEVLGDLAERCATPREYLREALRTLPFVIGSRIRRTTHPLGVLLAGAFLYWAIFYANTQRHWLVALIPTVLMLAVYALRDAWRDPHDFGRLARVGLMDAGLAALAVLLSQLMLQFIAPQMMLNGPALFMGLPIGLTLLYFARLQLPAGFHQPTDFARQMSTTELHGEIDVYEGFIRRSVRIELGACVVVCAAFLAYALFLDVPSVARAGMVITVLGAAFVAVFIWRHLRVRPIARDLDFPATVAVYRADMHRRVRLSRSYLAWYVAPIMIGPAIWIVGSSLLAPGGVRRAVIAASAFVIVACVMGLVPRGMAAKTQKRIDQLACVQPKAEPRL